MSDAWSGGNVCVATGERLYDDGEPIPENTIDIPFKYISILSVLGFSRVINRISESMKQLTMERIDICPLPEIIIYSKYSPMA